DVSRPKASPAIARKRFQEIPADSQTLRCGRGGQLFSRLFRRSVRSPGDYSPHVDRPSAIPFETKLRWTRTNDRLGWVERRAALSPVYPACTAATERNVSWAKTEGGLRQTAPTRRRARRKRSMAIGNRAEESCRLRHWNHAAVGLGLDAGKMRLQNFAIHGSRHGRGRVRCRRKQRDHFTRRKWFSRTNAGRLGRSTQQFDPQRGATENVRVARTRTHRKTLFVGELCPGLREVVTRSSAHSGRIAGFHRAPQFWTLEP